MILFCVGFVVFSTGETAWKEFTNAWSLIGGKIWQWPLIFSLHYHAINGIRHLIWDAGYGFEIKTVTQTGVLTLILSCIATLAFAHFCTIL